MNTKQISQIQFITQDTERYSHSELIEKACAGGIDWVQLRIKDISEEDYIIRAHEAKSICKKYGAKLIINDNVNVAKEVGADGVHLGNNDMSPREARIILGEDAIIGGTSNTYYDIINLKDLGVDYIGLGPYRYTNTKKNLSPLLGLEGYDFLLKMLKDNNVDIPIVSIGGIEISDIKEILSTGVHGIAVSSLISNADNIEQNTKQLIEEFNLLKC